MGRKGEVHLCKCGCGQPAAKNIRPSGRNKGWYRYAKGHVPPGPLADPVIREKARKTRYARLPIGTKRIHYVYGRAYYVIKIAHRKRWQLEHRYIIEQKLGRPLLKHEHIHHIDNNGLNNDPNNLMVVTNSEHAKITFTGRKTDCCCKCPSCGRVMRHFALSRHRSLAKATCD